MRRSKRDHPGGKRKKADKPIRSCVAAILQSRHYQIRAATPFAALPQG
jgi:hypothetical protein